MQQQLGGHKCLVFGGGEQLGVGAADYPSLIELLIGIPSVLPPIPCQPLTECPSIGDRA